MSLFCFRFWRILSLDRTLGWQSFFFRTVKMPVHSPLTSSGYKKPDIFESLFSECNVFFFLSAIKRLSLVFGSLTIIRPDRVFSYFYCSGYAELLGFIHLHSLAIISLNTFYAPFSVSSLCGAPITCMLDHLVLSHVTDALLISIFVFVFQLG